jgi:hypothetical protein
LDITPLRNANIVHRLTLQGSAIDDRVAPVIATLPQLEQLILQTPFVSTKALNILSPEHFPKLRRLGLDHVPIDRDVLERIASLHDLEFLKLAPENIASVDLRSLQPLRKLRFLELHGDGALDCSTLPVFPELRAIWCWATEIADSGLEQIAKQPALITLRMDHCAKITDQGLEFLATAPLLSRLSMTDTHLTGEGFRAFSPESPLSWIDARRSRLSDAGAKSLSRLKNVRTLMACNSALTDAGLKHLAQMPSLRRLGLGGTHITTLGVKNLSESRLLECVDLAHTDIDDGAVVHLAAIKSLKEACVRRTISTKAQKELEAAVPGVIVAEAVGLDDPFGGADEDTDIRPDSDEPRKK